MNAERGAGSSESMKWIQTRENSRIASTVRPCRALPNDGAPNRAGRYQGSRGVGVWCPHPALVIALTVCISVVGTQAIPAAATPATIPHEIPAGDNAPPTVRVQSILPRRQLVTLIQRNLSREGYDIGPIDGLMGPQTRSAIRAYQQANGLPVDGRATVTLYNFMQRDAAPQQDLAPPDPAPVPPVAAEPLALPSLDLRQPGLEPADQTPPTAAPTASLAEGRASATSGRSTTRATEGRQPAPTAVPSTRPSAGSVSDLPPPPPSAVGIPGTGSVAADTSPADVGTDIPFSFSVEEPVRTGFSETLIAGTTWRITDESGATQVMTFEPDGTISGTGFDRFVRWRQFGDSVQIQYDNGFGRTVYREGRLVEEGLRGDGRTDDGSRWRWTGTRIRNQ